ncbi:MAG: FlgD immunoglobulin-like domain containing protein, partial [Gemmataceae bacterium]
MSHPSGGVRKYTPAPRRPRRFISLQLEPLEDRCFPAVSLLGSASSAIETSGAQFEFTIPGFSVGAGTDRLLVVATGAGGNGTDVVTLTYGGTGLTRAINQSGPFGTGVEIWYLQLGSGSASTGDIVVTYDANAFFYATALVFQGVSQTTSLATTGNTGTSLTVSSSTGDLVLDAIIQSTIGPGSLVVDAGQTQRGNFDLGPDDGGGNPDGSIDGGVSTEPGAASVVMSWTSSGAAPGFAHAAVNIWATDTTAPTVNISAPSKTHAKTGDTVTYTVTYSDHVATANLTAPSVTLNKTGNANASSVVVTGGTISGGIVTYTVELSGLSGDGTLGITLLGGIAVDREGRSDPGGTSATFVVDNTPVAITNVSASPNPFSPNNSPSTFDETTISFQLSESATVSVIVDGAKTVFSGSLAAGTRSVNWDGKNSGGSFVADGTYTYRIQATDAAGNFSEQTGTVRVDNTSVVFSNVAANPAAISPANSPGIADSTTISYQQSEDATVSVLIDGVGALVDSVFQSAGTYNVPWDGKDLGGFFVADGDYTYRLQATDAAGNFSEFTGTIRVDNVDPVISSVIANPAVFSPIKSDQTSIGFNLNEVATVRVSIDGVVVLLDDVQLSAGNNSVLWNGRDADGNLVLDGVYTYRIQATDLAGNSSEQTGTVEVDNTSPVISNVSVSPDPFSPDGNGLRDDTTISYQVSEDVAVRVEILGQVLLLNDVSQSAGPQSVIWNGRDSGGFVVADGVYTYRILAVDAAGNSSEQTGTVEVDLTAPAAPVVADPAAPKTVVALSYTIEGSADADTFVQIYRDVDNNGVIDLIDTVVGSQQLVGGATDFSIIVPLIAETDNFFLVTARDLAGNESSATDVPTITQTPPADHFETSLWADFTTNSGWSKQLVGDFNGDGRDDIANFHPSNGNWWVSLAQPGGGFITTLWADFATNSGWTAQVVGDFNGDGDDDIANFHPSNGNWWVSITNDSHDGFITTLWADFATNSGWTSQIVGDFNGDGRDDIANFHPSNGNWWVSLANNTGDGFNTSLWADFSTNSGWTAQVVGDFNG